MVTKDRTDYRALPIDALREEVHYGIHVDWKELAIALGERLDEYQSRVEDMRYDHAELLELNARCDALRAEVVELRAALTAIE